jgi:hypothetical protein
LTPSLSNPETGGFSTRLTCSFCSCFGLLVVSFVSILRFHVFLPLSSQGTFSLLITSGRQINKREGTKSHRKQLLSVSILNLRQRGRGSMEATSDGQTVIMTCYLPLTSSEDNWETRLQFCHPREKGFFPCFPLTHVVLSKRKHEVGTQDFPLIIKSKMKATLQLSAVPLI